MILEAFKMAIGATTIILLVYAMGEQKKAWRVFWFGGTITVAAIYGMTKILESLAGLL